MNKQPLLYILVSAAFFGFSTPFAKILVADIPPVLLAGLLYTGAFIGLSLYAVGRKFIAANPGPQTAAPEKKDFLWLFAATVFGGIIAPISLMFGLSLTSGFAASLLLNLEAVATAAIAVLFFKENAGKQLWGALACMTLAGILLAWDSGRGEFNWQGPLMIVLSMICWGIDNNLTRHISAKDPIQIAMMKGFVSGAASITLAYLLGMDLPGNWNILLALLLGAFSYGISLVFFIKALAGLGASRTGVFFSLAPFIGAATSVILLKEWIGWVMFPAAGMMIAGIWLMMKEKHSHRHVHPVMTHLHLHDHDDLHHLHDHDSPVTEPHIHEHTHLPASHAHPHWPDTHHRHVHNAK